MAATKKIRSRGKLARPTTRPPVSSPLDHARPFEVVWDDLSELCEAARCLAGRSFVYLVGEEDDGPLKIGFAKDPVQRLRNLQTANSRPLRIERLVLGDVGVERLLHDSWADYHLSPRPEIISEWHSADLREYLHPVLATAAAEQVAYLRSRTSEVRMSQLARIVQLAHFAHGHTPADRDFSQGYRVDPTGAGERRYGTEAYHRFAQMERVEQDRP